MGKYILLLVFLLITTCAHAKTIRVCYEEWRPLAYVDSAGSVKGTVIEQLYLLSKKHNVAFVFDELPYNRCINLAKAGQYQFTLFIDNNDKLRRLTTPIALWHLAVVVPKRSLLTSTESLGTHINSMLLSRDYGYPDELLSLLKENQITPKYVSYYAANDKEVAAVFLPVEKGLIDAMLVDRLWAQESISRLALDLKVLSPDLIQVPQYVGFFSPDGESLQLMQKVLADFQLPKH